MKFGTSQAAAVVSGAAAQVLRFLKGLIAERNVQPGDLMFSLEGGPDRLSEYDATVRRLTGTAEPNASGA